MKRILLCLCGCGIGLGIINQTFAVDLNDEDMKIKGYNSETIRIVNMQKSRMEGQEPQPPMTKTKRFFRNIWKNEWTESLDEFGYTNPSK